MKKFKQFVARQREGIFFGGLGGVIVFLLRDKIVFIQKLMVGNAWLGNLAIFIFIGMSVGLLIDSEYKKKV